MTGREPQFSERTSAVSSESRLFCFQFLKGCPNGGNDKGRKSAVLSLNCLFCRFNDIVREADGFICGGVWLEV